VPKGKLTKELKYLRIFNEIREEILNGKLPPGTQLLGFRELMVHYAASYSTVAKTLGELEQHGLITRRQGKGIFVAPRPSWRMGETESNFVGLIVTDMNIPFFNRIIHTVENEVTALRYHLVVRNTEFDSQRERQIVQEFIAQRFQGILLVPTFDEQDSDFLQSVDGKAIPIVYVNRHKWGYDCSYVVPDDYAGATAVMEYLFEMGHRDVGYFAGDKIVGRDLRFKAYEECLRLRGQQVNPEWILYAPWFEMEGGYACMNRLLQLRKRPTAVFCYSDAMAAGAMRACQEQGLRVPEDISLVGCNDDEVCRVMRPNLTTLANPIEQISSQVVRILFESMKSPPGQRVPLQLKMPMRLVQRQSVRRI